MKKSNPTTITDSAGTELNRRKTFGRLRKKIHYIVKENVEAVSGRQNLKILKIDILEIAGGLTVTSRSSINRRRCFDIVLCR